MSRSATIAMALMFALLSGCGLFDTREPENPITSGSNNESATSPTLVLRNMENALNAANVNDYRKCFSDTSQGLPPFIFQPTSQGIAAGPTKFLNWSAADEEIYFRNIVNELADGDQCSVSFSPTTVDDPPIGDSVQFTANYVAHFPHTRTGFERDARGSLQFTFRRSKQNVWYISYWRDFVIDNQTSWSLIKARFSDN